MKVSETVRLTNYCYSFVCVCVWDGGGGGWKKVQPYPKQALVFTCLQYKSFENIAGKGEIARLTARLTNYCCYSFARVCVCVCVCVCARAGGGEEKQGC